MTEKQLTSLVINKVATQSLYDEMKTNGQINEDELYLVGGSGNVESVNGQTGIVALSASDVGALSSDTTYVSTVDGASGAITTNAVKYTSQTLTDAEKTQARTNIGAGTSSFSGSYNDLTNKPSIPSKTSELTNDSDFITSDGTVAKANKLASAHTLNGVAFDGSQDITGTFTTGLYESYMGWGGQNIAGDITPIDAGMCSLLASNRAEFCKADGITVEYTTDGSTWQDYGLADVQKRRLLSMIGTSDGVYIGKCPEGTKPTTNYKLRVTVKGYECGFYTVLKKVLIYISTGGAPNCKLLVETAKMNDQNTFTTYGTYQINGWSGWNSIPIQIIFGASYTGQNNIDVLRFTFYLDEVSETYDSRLWTSRILFFGTTNWVTPSQMAATGHLYSYDIDQNAYFPNHLTTTGEITASRYNGSASLTGVPTAPTADAGTNTTQIATTEFVATAVANSKFSGSYNDLTDTPTIPSKVSELMNDSKYITSSGAPVQSVNGKTGVVSLSASDVGALPDTVTIPSPNDSTVTIQKNGTTVDSFTTNAATDKSINITVPTTASEVGAVPTSRTVNGKALNADITLTANDVSALPASTTSLKNPKAITFTGASTGTYDGSNDLVINIPQAETNATFFSAHSVALSNNWTASGDVYTQTVALSKVHAESVLIVSPAPSYKALWIGNNVYCSEQSEGYLTFVSKAAITDTLVVNVVLANLSEEQNSSATTATLSASGWSNNAQTVSASGVASDTMVIVGPATSAIDLWRDHAIYCSAQGSGTLTFGCQTTPSSDVVINIIAISG